MKVYMKPGFFFAIVLGILTLIPANAFARHTVVYESDPYYGRREGVSIHYRGGYHRRHYDRSYDRSLATRVQRALQRRGYFHGDVDGSIGPRSSRSIAHYQHDMGLPVTGRIDRYLLRSLGI
jgi:hypothetical protein